MLDVNNNVLLQTVNGHPSEKVIYATDYLIVSSCQSGAYANNPTCGWYKDTNQNNIPDSEVHNSIQKKRNA